MMLSHPVLLGLVWSLLVHSTSGQSRTSNTDSNKVYAYSYHFLHNGTTNSKEILRSVLGNDPEFGLDIPDGKSIVKTFSSPGIRGFFTKGVLPAGPVRHSFNNELNSPLSDIKKIVESNLQPPPNIAAGLLPPVSPDISREFPGDFNNVNNIGRGFQNHNDFPKIPSPPVIPVNDGHRKVQNFARDTPDGGRVVGREETFSYNPPPITNSVSRIEENSHGFLRNENILNNDRQVTGHRTQSYFRQQHRTITPNSESHSYNQNNIVNSRSFSGPNNNNQWWNALNVLGNRNNNPNLPAPQINNQINQNINDIQNNINRAFGARLNGFRQNDFGTQTNVNHYNQNQNFNNPLPIQNVNNNRAFPNIPNTPFTPARIQNNQQNILNNNVYPNIPGPGLNINNRANINNYSNRQIPNNQISTQFNKETENKVMNLINDVSSHLKNLRNNQGVNNVGPTWDDDVTRNINNDWSIRQSNLNRRPFSNGHSGPSNILQPQPEDILRKTFDTLITNRNFQNPRNHDDSYRNVDGGGIEKFYGSDRTVNGPNSFSRNQQRGYERDFNVNSNSGYSRSNQWSTNVVRRLDAQSSKPDFSKDFIDVFRED